MSFSSKIAGTVLADIFFRNPQATFTGLEQVGSYIGVDTTATSGYRATQQYVRRMRRRVEESFIKRKDAARTYLESTRKGEIQERNVFDFVLGEINKEEHQFYLAKINGKYKQPTFEEVQAYVTENGIVGAKFFVSNQKRVCLMGGKPENLPLSGGFDGRYSAQWSLLDHNPE